MAEFKLKKGYDIKIAGRAEQTLETVAAPRKVALQPPEFRGVKPRLQVKVGDLVKQGTPLFIDKQNPEVKFVSPVSGTVTEINRGERRVLREIVIENDQKNDVNTVGDWSQDDINAMPREQIVKALLDGGVWPFLIQRPFSKIADPADTPRDIFVSGMDTAPLAANSAFLLQGEEKNFQQGLDILQKLSGGSVYLSIDASEKPAVFENARGVEKHYFSGPHPAGNVGVQIHHIKSIKQGEKVWVVKPGAVALIGKFFNTGHYPAERIVAVAGSSLNTRKYFKTISGAPVAMLVPENNIADDEVRFISGNVLTGRKISAKAFVGYSDELITVIPEGKKERTLLGYFLPGLNTPSFSKTFMSQWFGSGKKEYKIDTQMHGGHRAFVMSASDYERMMPMDILPVHLIKAIMAEDIEEMEGLGISELDEEDIALCSYMCLSKTDFGGLLRKGLDMIEREG